MINVVGKYALFFFAYLRAIFNIAQVKNNSEILNWAINILILANSFVLHSGVIL